MPITRLLALFAVSLLTLIGAVQAQPVDGGHARVALVTDRAVAVPGETVWFGLSFEMDPNWHIYWENAGDAGIPPSIQWSDDFPFGTDAIGEISWPVPELLPILPGEIMDYGYSEQVTLPFPVTIPENALGDYRFSGTANYLICEDICIPESVELRLLLSAGVTQVPDQRGAALITSALADNATLFDGTAHITEQDGQWLLSVAGEQVEGVFGDVRFFPRSHDIQHAADQPASIGPQGLQLQLTPADADAPAPEALSGIVRVGDAAFDISATPGPVLDGTRKAPGASLIMFMLLGLIGGLILNLMPCVLPVLSIKAMGVVSAAASGNAGEARAHGLWYTLGVLLSFAGLAAAIVAVRAATGIATWGFWMQDPLVMTGLVLLIFIIGLWLLGVFELGGSVQNLGDGLTRKQGAAGAFFTGVLAVIVGAPCTGPFLGAALGGIMGQPAPQIFAVLLAMGLGLALPFLLLSFVPSLQRKMPKPGEWMETLKQVFAFPMFLTSAYFLWTLGDLAGTMMVAMTVAGAAAIAFGLWAFNKQGAGARAILASLLGIGAILPIFGLMSAISAGSGAEIGVSLAWAGLVIGLFGFAVKGDEPYLNIAVKIVAIAAVAGGLIGPMLQARSGGGAQIGRSADAAEYPAEAWSPQRVEALTAEGRPVFVDFTATWCVNCQANKRSTLQKAAVSDAFTSGNVAFLVADYTRPDPVIAAELQKRGRAGVPMYLWYPAGESEPVVLPEILSVGLVTGLVEDE